MSLSRFEEALRDLVRPPFQGLGFVESEPLVFRREIEDGWEVAAFGWRVEDDRFHFSCTVGIEFPAIEKVIRPAPEARAVATVFVPIHFLFEGREFFEWTMTAPVVSEDLRSEVFGVIGEEAMDFWAKYSTLERVKRSLESENGGDWFIFGPEQRLATLASAYVSLGEKERAIAVLEEGLEERRDALPKKRRRLEQLRDRLVALT